MVFDAFLRFRVRAHRPSSQAIPLPTKDKQATIRQPRPDPPETAGKKDHHTLLAIGDLPAWRDPNPFVLTGYRQESQSCWDSFTSWRYWHNESCNIYSHLIPGVVLLFSQGALYDYIRARHWALDGFDWTILTLQLLSASFCFLVSALYHTLLNHSPGVAHRWLQLDYVGIIILILGNFVSGLHFGFYCSPSLKYFYWSLVSASRLRLCRVPVLPLATTLTLIQIIALGITTGIALLTPKFRGPEWRSFRLGSFVCTGLSAFAPIGHAGTLWGLPYIARIGVPYYLLEGLLLGIGCYFWEVRYPILLI